MWTVDQLLNALETRDGKMPVAVEMPSGYRRNVLAVLTFPQDEHKLVVICLGDPVPRD